jgi:hypothetical protein
LDAICPPIECDLPVQWTRSVDLGDDVRMSDASNGNRRSSALGESPGILANLPRTRPQRSSARRAAARRGTAPAANVASATAAPPVKTAKKAQKTARATSSAKAPTAKNVSHAAARAKRAPDPPRVKRSSDPAKRTTSTKRSGEAVPVPRQGFETESEIGSGSVRPPGGTELVAAAAEIVGELTKAGLATGERLMRDVLSRLPLS